MVINFFYSRNQLDLCSFPLLWGRFTADPLVVEDFVQKMLNRAFQELSNGVSRHEILLFNKKQNKKQLINDWNRIVQWRTTLISPPIRRWNFNQIKRVPKKIRQKMKLAIQ